MPEQGHRSEAQGYGHFELGIFGIENVVVSEHFWSTKGAYGVEATSDCCDRKHPGHNPHGLHTLRLYAIFERE